MKFNHELTQLNKSSQPVLFLQSDLLALPPPVLPAAKSFSVCEIRVSSALRAPLCALSLPSKVAPSGLFRHYDRLTCDAIKAFNLAFSLDKVDLCQSRRHYHRNKKCFYFDVMLFTRQSSGLVNDAGKYELHCWGGCETSC